MKKHADRIFLGVAALACVAALLAVAAGIAAFIRACPGPAAVMVAVCVGIYSIGWAFEKLGFCE